MPGIKSCLVHGSIRNKSTSHRPLQVMHHAKIFKKNWRQYGPNGPVNRLRAGRARYCPRQIQEIYILSETSRTAQGPTQFLGRVFPREG